MSLLRTLIVNADDFGNDENRTRAILEAFRIGAISHTTGMVNMPYFESALSLLKRAGLVERLGLHLNLTEGPALTERMRECAFFCDDASCFNCAMCRSMKNRLFLPKAYQDVLRDEIEAQMRRFRELGCTSDHFDSHHHVHTYYSIARIAFPLARKYGFKSVRISRNLPSDLGLMKKLYKWPYNHFLIPKVGRRSCWFGSFTDFKRNFSRIKPGESVEVMVHPMYGASVMSLSMNGALTDGGINISDEELVLFRGLSEKFELI